MEDYNTKYISILIFNRVPPVSSKQFHTQDGTL